MFYFCIMIYFICKHFWTKIFEFEEFVASDWLLCTRSVRRSCHYTIFLTNFLKGHYSGVEVIPILCNSYALNLKKINGGLKLHVKMNCIYMTIILYMNTLPEKSHSKTLFNCLSLKVWVCDREKTVIFTPSRRLKSIWKNHNRQAIHFKCVL